MGDSGDAFTIPSGVTITNNGTQVGFGRTGTVDWDTSIHTGTVTAATGKGYFVNTTAGEITVNLPAAAVGSIVAVSDYASTANTNNIVVSPNGSEKINGENEDYPISTNGLAVTLVYADATRGWKSVTGSAADATGVGALFVVATGGTPCTGAICGNLKPMYLQDQELFVFLVLEMHVDQIQQIIRWLQVAVEVEVMRQEEVELEVLDFLILSDVLLLQSCHL